MTDGRSAVEGIDWLTTMRELLAEVERWHIVAARCKGSVGAMARDSIRTAAACAEDELVALVGLDGVAETPLPPLFTAVVRRSRGTSHQF